MIFGGGILKIISQSLVYDMFCSTLFVCSPHSSFSGVQPEFIQLVKTNKLTKTTDYLYKESILFSFLKKTSTTPF